MVTVERLGATAVEDSAEPEIVFRLADPDHERRRVTLWCDLDLAADLDLRRVPGGWELRLPLPPLDCLEYMFEIDGSLEPDPGNPDLVDGAFGAHSWLAMPGYQEPAWLGLEPVPGIRRPMRVDRTPVGRVELSVWQPDGVPDAMPLPVLVAHDGPEIDRYSHLTRYVAALIGTGDLPPMRVALVAPGQRDERYAANPAYATALTSHVVPRLLRRFPSDHAPVLSGQSLGGLAALYIAWTSAPTFAALFLQSGSYFTPDLDPQESDYPHFDAVTDFVALVRAARSQAPNAPKVAMTCGTVEENLANNRLVYEHLVEIGLDVTWGEARQGHTWTCWRDTFDPHLTGLLGRVWAS